LASRLLGKNLKRTIVYVTEKHRLRAPQNRRLRRIFGVGEKGKNRNHCMMRNFIFSARHQMLLV
jgi:hypothetical protein